ncbi:MAG: 2-succinyl-5-enolpyruvyl-6-hydroxy-3-cyclohexene-1-carboxylic-acid synthase, partial [Candidatus Dadabacteria bacterium]
MNVASANRAAAAALFDALYAGGVRHVCISPGSRSTPLVLAVASQSRFRCWVITDERSSAYFALGLARATGDAVAVITTSGTAVANLVPAASEAMRARVPLVFVTADRPRETRDSGAPQTIAQAGALFSHVRFQADLVTPFAGQADLTRYYRAVAARALAVARGIEPGPVHLNVPLREPLLDERDLQGSPERERAVSEAVAHVRVERGELGLGEALAGELAEQLSR